MIEFILLACAGVICGIFTGLVPGIHPNTLALLILSVSPLLLTMFSPAALAVFIIAAGIIHTFLDFIPSVFLGAPEDSTALSVLPGHRFLLEGRAYEAIFLTLVGGIGVIILSILLFPLLNFTLPFIYEGIRSYIAYVLMGIVLVMVLTEKRMGKLKGLFVFFMAGLLGFIVMDMPMLNSNTLLFPIFTGLFGISTMLLSLSMKSKIPKQKTEKISIGNKTSFIAIIKGFFSGMFVGILPGIGAAQAAVLTNVATKQKDVKQFLISLGGINTVAALFSLMALYLISKPRSGIAIAVGKIIEAFGFDHLLLLMFTALFVAGLGVILTLKISKVFSKVVQKVDYKKLTLTIIMFLVILTIVLAGPVGLFLLGISTVVGLLAPLMNVKRTHSMGVLMLPIMLFYLGI